MPFYPFEGVGVHRYFLWLAATQAAMGKAIRREINRPFSGL